MNTISKQTGAPLTYFATEFTNKRISTIIKETKANVTVKYEAFDDLDDFLIMSREVQRDDLFVVVSARTGGISYNSVLQTIPKQLSKHFQKVSFVIIYPEQKLVGEPMTSSISVF